MRNPRLHAALRAFAQDAGALLAADLDAGAELAFDVVEQGGGSGPALYRYRPFSAAFVDARWHAVRALETYAAAIDRLESRADAYLRHRAAGGSGPEAALRDVVYRLYDDSTAFQLAEDRFERVYAELEAAVEETTVVATVLAPLHGVRISRARVELGGGLALIRRSEAGSPPAALEGFAHAPEPNAEAGGPGSGASANPLDVFCELSREAPLESPLPVDEARVRFRRVLTALRLCGAGGSALGALAWSRAGAGAWHPVALGVSARSRSESWELRHAEETELSELLEILALSRHGRSVGWALDRFEMGCERGLEVEALSDYLLALRALLAEPGTPEAGMALRLAALCSPEPDRRAIQQRVERALALEREMAFGDCLEAGATSLDSPRGLVREIEGYLRALLRDVLCGYLEEELRWAADALLLAAAPVAGDDADTEEFDAVDPHALRASDAREPSSPDGADRELVGAGVTPSADWPLEPDPAGDWEGYSAPV